jgi:manganese/zinc/iron transport system permease protein
MNPYSGQNFFGFFIQLIQRFGAFFSGNLSFNDLATDEIQILVLIGIAISGALVGTFLILRKMTMLANSLSHTILLGIVIAYVFFHTDENTINLPILLAAAFGTGLATTFLTEFLTKTVRLQEDASIGIVFTSLFSVGIILATVLTRNVHIGTEAVMGNVDALQLDDCKLVYAILGLNVVLVFLFFKEYKITTFDPALSKAMGISTVFFNYLLMAQTSATSIAGFRAVGVLMILSFITGPALTARLVTHDLKKMLYYAIGIGCFSSLVGVALSRHMLSVYGIALTTSGLVVCVIAAVFVLTYCIKLCSQTVKSATKIT